MNRSEPLTVRFYRTQSGNEPVRAWLQTLSREDKKTIGEDIKTVQYGWPLGMPLIRKLEPDLWEIRISLGSRIARVLFTMEDNHNGRQFDRLTAWIHQENSKNTTQRFGCCFASITRP